MLLFVRVYLFSRFNGHSHKGAIIMALFAKTNAAISALNNSVDQLASAVASHASDVNASDASTAGQLGAIMGKVDAAKTALDGTATPPAAQAPADPNAPA